MNELVRKRILYHAGKGKTLQAIADMEQITVPTVVDVLRGAGVNRARSESTKKAWQTRQARAAAGQHTRLLEREAEEARRRVAVQGSEVRIHAVEAAGELRVILRLYQDDTVVDQQSGNAEDSLGLGRAVLALLLRPPHSSVTLKRGAASKNPRSLAEGEDDDTGI